MKIYFSEGAAGGEVEDAPPGDGRVEPPLEEEGRGAVAGEEGLGGVGAEVLDQGPAEVAGDEVVLEGDRPRLFPDARPLGSGPGEEPFLHFERGRDVEPRHDLVRMERRAP